MMEMQITRRRLLQAGGVVMVSSLLPFNALAGSPAAAGKAILTVSAALLPSVPTAK